jgi:hypothetical protein
MKAPLPFGTKMMAPAAGPAEATGMKNEGIWGG